MGFNSIEIFKGGSLGRTELMQNQAGLKIVRKSISIKKNREYGLVRWQSQYKRLQRYNLIFPDTFPKLLQVGSDQSTYFFDMEYLEGFINLKDYLSNRTFCESEVIQIVEKVFHLAFEMHTSINLKSNIGVFNLYLQEECFNKLDDALLHPRFEQFVKHERIVFNNQEVKNLSFHKEWIQRFASELKISSECYTHGNLTLENILYNPESNIVKFIDPYDENIIDCAESDFSQIKQCSEGHYGLIMKSKYSIEANRIQVNYKIPESFELFSDRLDKLVSENLSNYNYKSEDFFYISQFYRMLPFKVQSANIDQAIIFYGLACKLTQNLRDKYE